ncbi:MAG: glycosyltransferase, partial [Bdellovibrionales bacterium]|nr:glycosyltransferase [Bdellovibrionales bacterium]
YASDFLSVTGAGVLDIKRIEAQLFDESSRLEERKFQGDPSALSFGTVKSSAQAIATLEQPYFERRAPLSIVVPIYNSLDALMGCVESYLALGETSAKLILVNDCSDAGTSEWISNVAALYPEQIIALHKEVNGGFIEACRTGLDAVPQDHDIILLNSDVLLTKDAIRNLRDAAYCRPWVGLASPVSTGSPKLEIKIPAGSDLAATAALISNEYQPRYPTVITPEGQCLYVRRWAIDEFGFFDRIYERGFCEESDLAMRMFTCGVDMVCADNALIGHERSASFGKGARNRHLERNRPVFMGRWGSYYHPAAHEFVRRNELQALRDFVGMHAPALQGPSENLALEGYLETIEATVEEIPAELGNLQVLDDTEVVFLLPSVVTGGGSLSTLQHANEMIRRGVKARILSLTIPGEVQFQFRAPVIPVSFQEFFQIKKKKKKVVATFWLTAYFVAELKKRCPTIDAYYYVQDYEPWFYSKPDRFKVVQAAEKTFELDLKCVAKTKYLQDVVREHHQVSVAKVTPGVQRSVFYPGQQEQHFGRPRLAGLFRARTPRRGGKELVRLLERLFVAVPELDVTLFGDSTGLPEEIADRVNLVGALSQRQVADLYRRSDMVIDLSFWHGFGRMGIEGMACGAVPVLSDSGGVREYATPDQNSLFIDTAQLDEAVAQVLHLCRDRDYRLKLRAQGLQDLKQISEEHATEDWLSIFGIKPREGAVDLPLPPGLFEEKKKKKLVALAG